MDLLSKARIFGRTRALEDQIDEFLNGISQAGLTFKLAVRTYLVQGATQEFEDRLQQVNQLESRGDTLRRGIERELYAHMLLPESRGDVLSLLENLDKILNRLEGALWGFSIETPEILPEFSVGFQTLAEMVVQAVEEVVSGARCFFRNLEAVGEHTHKVLYYEKEADKTSSQLKRAIFKSSLPLASKNHLRYFVEQIDGVADRAEDVADRLAIYTIKHRI